MLSAQELLGRAYEAFNARDIDGVLATMRADVEWPNGMEGGTYAATPVSISIGRVSGP
jgi:ketosteroid isomerase-like protein